MQGDLPAIALNALISFGCLKLAVKGFSAEGLPLARTKRLSGYPARLVGALCALLGLVFLAACGLVAWLSLSGRP